jgi:hypothetical protein
MQFRTTILQGDKTATGIQVPEAIVTALGSGKRPKVRVTLNGYTYRSSIAPMGGVFMVGVSDEVRRNAGVAGGDTVDVDIELDTEPRVVTVPPELAEALAADDHARRVFEGLSYSNQLRHALGVETAKTDETRQRRLAATMDELRQGVVR